MSDNYPAAVRAYCQAIPERMHALWESGVGS